MGPINYLGAMPQVNLGQTVQSGLQTGAGFAQLIQQRQQEQQQAMAAQQQAEELARAHEAVRANPRDWRAQQRLMQLDPAQREPLQMVLRQMTETERQSAMDYALRVTSALESGNPDVAASVVERRIEAIRNAGEDPSEHELFLAEIRKDPEKATEYAERWLLQALPPEEIVPTMGRLDEQRRARDMAPAQQRTAEAQATTAEATAEFARQNELTRLEERGWNIRKLQSDIAYQREQTRINAIQASLAKETNDLKRRELEQKLEDAQRSRDGQVREKAAKAETAAQAIDNMLNQLELVENAPGLREVIGSLEGQRFFPNVAIGTMASLGPARIATSTGQERADALALIETLTSQVFLTQFDKLKGGGAITNIEGEKAQNAFQSLQRTQSLPQFRQRLAEARRQLIKTREALEKETGIPLSRPDIPAAQQNGRPPLDSFQR
jgi:hypothetical protein